MELVYENGYLYDKDSELLTRVKIKGNPNIDMKILNKLYDLCGNEMVKIKLNKQSIINTFFSFNITELYKYIYETNKCTKENKQQLIDKLILFNDIFGNTNCIGKNDYKGYVNKDLSVLTFIEWIYVDDSVKLSSSYFEYAITQRWIND